MPMQCRLVWDCLASPWTDISDPLVEAIARGTNVHLVLNPPTEWRFNVDMIRQLKGQIALEATRVEIEFRARP